MATYFTDEDKIFYPKYLIPIYIPIHFKLITCFANGFYCKCDKGKKEDQFIKHMINMNVDKGIKEFRKKNGNKSFYEIEIQIQSLYNDKLYHAKKTLRTSTKGNKSKASYFLQMNMNRRSESIYISVIDCAPLVKTKVSCWYDREISCTMKSLLELYSNENKVYIECWINRLKYMKENPTDEDIRQYEERRGPKMTGVSKEQNDEAYQFKIIAIAGLLKLFNESETKDLINEIKQIHTLGVLPLEQVKKRFESELEFFWLLSQTQTVINNNYQIVGVEIRDNRTNVDDDLNKIELPFGDLPDEVIDRLRNCSEFNQFGQTTNSEEIK